MKGRKPCQLFKIRALHISSYVEYSFEGDNGYIKYRNGLIIQWGYDRATYESNYITLPISFSVDGYKVILQRDVANASSLALLGALPDDPAQFRVVTDMTSANPAFRYIAIGY